MLKLPFFNPTSPHHHASSRIIARAPLRYVTPDTDTLLYHLFLFSEVEKKPEDNPSSEDPMVKKKITLYNLETSKRETLNVYIHSFEF